MLNWLKLFCKQTEGHHYKGVNFALNYYKTRFLRQQEEYRS